MSGGHAELSGSGSYRWIRCPGSIRMTAAAHVGGGGGGGSNPYAREGTFAHAVAAHILNTDKTPDVGSEFIFMDHDEEIVDEITEEMLGYVMIYVNHVRQHGKKGVVKIEQHVDLSAFVREDMYGTADAIISKSRELVVSDFKYGFYPVLLIDDSLILDDTWGELGHVNSQLLYYAAGSAHAHGWKHPLITLEIVQPRCMEVPDVQTTTVTREQLKKWAEEDLWRAAHLATSEGAPLSAGEWCRFCPALSICPEARKAVQNLAVADFADLSVQSPEIPEIAAHLTEVLTWAPIVEAWIRACEAHAMNLMRQGMKLPGFKLVKKRANRTWPELSNEEIFKQLKAAGAKIGKLEQFIETTFISPARAEKIAGKKAVNAVCEHPEGDVTVAAESDRRPAISTDLKSDFEEFAEGDDYKDPLRDTQ